MTYMAQAVARHIVTYCTRIGNPISNLKLQKLLYFVWIEYYKKTGNELFFDNMYAWPLGPVVPIVYREFSPYAGLPIQRIYTEECKEEDVDIIDNIVNSFVDISARDLVDMSHRPGGPWDIVYKNGIGARQLIPFRLIKELACN